MQAEENGGARADEGTLTAPDEFLRSLLQQRSAEASCSKRLIMAVDFGTTYSAISCVAIAEGEDPKLIPKSRIFSIQNYPGDSTDPWDRMRNEVPTEAIYPSDFRFRKKEQWGGLQPTSEHEDADDAEEAAEEEGLDEDDDEIDPFDVSLDDEPSGTGANANTDADSDMADADGFDESSLRNEPQHFQWGYEVHEAWQYPETHYNKYNQALARFKLLLDESPVTQEIRNQLASTINTLTMTNMIKDPLTPIADYLTCLLRHADSELRAQGYDDSYPVELVMCVPAIWKQKACREMQRATAMAIRQARFRRVKVQNNSIENLFIVSEPEAAAAYVLTMDRTVAPRDVFVLLDAGGGTVDANTYRVSMTMPLRLESEIVPPGGGLHGSSFLNEDFQKLLMKKLEGESYLVQDKVTIKGIVESLMIKTFEQDIKRTFDINGPKTNKRLVVHGLQHNPQKHFYNGSIYLKHETIEDIFMQQLKGIEKILMEQIRAAHEKGIHVDKVVLIGGFGASRSLQYHLRVKLEALSKRLKRRIEPVFPENHVTAVASGAVLRALNKDQGPKRIARSSYGILRSEPFEEFKEHDGVKPTIDPYDGELYVTATIDWLLKKGTELTPVWTCERFSCTHYVPARRKKLICREVLFVSDTATLSHYKRSHRYNKDVTERVGEMIVDFTYLRQQRELLPREAVFFNEAGLERRRGKKYYKIQYDMIIQVVDRDLSCYAIYKNKEVQRAHINIASAFDLGAR